jgi:flagellar basal-body rod protein FlgB
MYENLYVMRMANELAQHAGQRQAEIARNVANADTPGYRAKDIASFQDSYDAGLGLPMRATRPEHLANAQAGQSWQVVDAPDSQSPNGNTVSLEEQMLKAAEVRQNHDMALTVYTTALSILRTSIGGR